MIYLAYKNNSFVILLPKDADFFTKLIDCNGSNNWLFLYAKKKTNKSNENQTKKNTLNFEIETILKARYLYLFPELIIFNLHISIYIFCCCSKSKHKTKQNNRICNDQKGYKLKQKLKKNIPNQFKTVCNYLQYAFVIFSHQKTKKKPNQSTKQKKSQS